MRAWLLAVLALLLLTVPSSGQRSAGPGAGASADALPFAAVERTLPNGLRVIVVPTGFPHLVTIEIPVQVGSRHEVEAGKSGFAHFFEHVLAGGGTPTMTPEARGRILKSAGARTNANTNSNFTRYYATFAKEDFEAVLKTYADSFQHLTYSEPDFKTESRAVLGEYNRNSADPVRRLTQVQREHFYRIHPYKHTTLGFLADIEAMSSQYEYSKMFFERWYRPERTTVIVAGDVTASEVLPVVQRYWGAWKGSESAQPSIPAEPPPAGPRYAHESWNANTLPLVSVAFFVPGWDEQSKDTAALDLIRALYFGPTSELFNKLVIEEQRVDSLEAPASEDVDPSLMTIIATVRKPEDAIYVRDRILAAAASARVSAMTTQRLADTRSFIRYSLSRALDSTERIAATISRYAAFERSFSTLNRYFQTLDSVTPEDLERVAQRHFVDAGVMVTTLSRTPLPSGI